MSDASGAPEVPNAASGQEPPASEVQAPPVSAPEPAPAPSAPPAPEPAPQVEEATESFEDVPATAAKKSQFNPEYSAPVRRGPQIYTTQAGDDLASIAEKFDVVGGADALYALNDTSIGESPNILRPGIALNIP